MLWQQYYKSCRDFWIQNVLNKVAVKSTALDKVAFLKLGLASDLPNIPTMYSLKASSTCLLTRWGVPISNLERKLLNSIQKFNTKVGKPTLGKYGLKKG